MIHLRRHVCITDTGDLSATLRPAGQLAQFDASVLELSERGMLTAGGGFEVGESVGIELAGPHFRLAGRAEVVHCNGRKTGLRMVSWAGPADRVICALVAARLPGTRGSRSGHVPRTARQHRSSGAPTVLVADDPLRALSALILENSDDNAALAASVAFSPPPGSRFR